MNVRFAVETMSNSVADVIEQLCEDKYEGFVGSETTVELIRLSNNVFDVMNHGEDKKTNNLFKQPICESTFPAILDLFERFRKFVDEISFEKVNKKRRIDKNTHQTLF